MSRRPIASFLVSAVLLVTAAVPAFADLNRKLDPTARIALNRLRSGEPASAVRAEGRLSVSAVGELDVFITGKVTRGELEAAGARVRTALPGVFTAWLPIDKVDAVAALADVNTIEGAQIDEVTNDQGTLQTGAAFLRGAGPAFAGINGAGVIVANIDTGVDYHHDDFKDNSGNTRILKIWDQTAAGSGPPGSGFAYGREWSSTDINTLVSTEKDTHGHGTHTMGTAAGDGSSAIGGSAPPYSYAGMAPMADIIVVRSADNGMFSPTKMLDGINYVFQKATALGKNAAVNVSVGGQGGPKDGTSAFELGVDALLNAQPGRMVVLAAGNDRNATLHDEWFPGNPNPTMSISGVSSAARLLVIYGYYEASEQLNVSVITPNSTVVGPVALGGTSGNSPGPATANGNVYIENGVSLTATGDKKVYIELNAANSTAINGTWTFQFTPVVVGPANCEVDMFRTFQSVLMTANFVNGNQPNEELINDLATGHLSLAAGAHVSRQTWTDCSGATVSYGQPAVGNIASFSSPGPTRDGRMKPDVSGPGTAIVSARSGDAPGVCSSPDADLAGLLHTANQGTSMSAPFVTGMVALLYQKYGALTAAQVQTQVHNRASVDGFVTAFGPVPNKDFGWGKLNVGDMSDPTCTVTSPNGGEFLVMGDPVNLTWNAADGVGVTGVDLELSRNDGANWETIALNVPNAGSYGWVVTGPPATHHCLFRATAKDGSANSKVDVSNAVWSILAGPVGVGQDDQPVTVFAVDGVRPSVVADQAVIEYSVPRAADVRVALFDLQGREVAVLASGPHTVGHHRVPWNGEVDHAVAPAGVYFVRLTSPGGIVASNRFVVAR